MITPATRYSYGSRDAAESKASTTCPPCSGDCNQGRNCAAALHQAPGGQAVEEGRALHAASYAIVEPDDADGLAPLTELAWLFAALCTLGLFLGIGLGIARHILKQL